MLAIRILPAFAPSMRGHTFVAMLRHYMRTLLPALAVALLLVAGAGSASAQSNHSVPTAPNIQLPPGSNYLPPPPPPDEDPYDDASVVSISAPASMTPGSTAYATVTMRNAGNLTWTSGGSYPYQLGSQNPQDNTTWGTGRVALNGAVAPGGQGVFGFVITAPSTPGMYSFSWAMLQEGVHWFGSTASTTITVSAPPPFNSSQLIAANVPTTMTAGSYYNVSLTFKNTGNLTWTSPDYLLANPDDNFIWGLNRVSMSTSSVPPGQSTTFNFQVRAPTTAGTYPFQWGMVWEFHERFGQFGSSNITVNPPVTPKPGISASHTAMVAGQGFTMNWSTSDATSLSHVCTAAGTGYTVNESLPVNGSRAMTAQAGWVSYPSTCTWTASGPGGSTTYTETLTTTAGATPKPTINVARPSLVAGQSFTTSWSTTDATSLTHVCTAAGTGYNVNESLAVNGSRTLTAQSGWVGNPSSCTWTASGAGGTATYTETMTTVTGANGSVTYIHTDGLGSPVARTDASGTVISRTRYEPYGYVASGAMPTIGFTGHVNDADTGLTYMQQRYYDPVAGRFLSIDPVVTDVSTGGSFNRYAYANNNPYKYTDLDGRNPAVALGMGGAEVGTAVFPGVGTIIGGAIGAGVGWYLGDKAATWIASTVGGNRGSPMDVKDGTNPPTTIGGRDYSGHSQDRMQGRGVPPSAVEEAIKNGTAEASRGGTTVYTDSKNGVQVVVNADGKVVTVKHVKSDKGGGGNNNQNGPKKDDKPKEPDPKPPKTE